MKTSWPTSETKILKVRSLDAGSKPSRSSRHRRIATRDLRTGSAIAMARGVGTMPSLVRTKSGSSPSRSRASWLLTADWVRLRVEAAMVTLRVCRMASKTRSRLRSRRFGFTLPPSGRVLPVRRVDVFRRVAQRLAGELRAQGEHRRRALRVEAHVAVEAGFLAEERAERLSRERGRHRAHVRHQQGLGDLAVGGP